LILDDPQKLIQRLHNLKRQQLILKIELKNAPKIFYWYCIASGNGKQCLHLHFPLCSQNVHVVARLQHLVLVEALFKRKLKSIKIVKG